MVFGVVFVYFAGVGCWLVVVCVVTDLNANAFGCKSAHSEVFQSVTHEHGWVDTRTTACMKIYLHLAASQCLQMISKWCKF